MVELSPRRLQQLAGERVLPRAEKGHYVFGELVDAILDHEVAKSWADSRYCSAIERFRMLRDGARMLEIAIDEIPKEAVARLTKALGKEHAGEVEAAVNATIDAVMDRVHRDHNPVDVVKIPLETYGKRVPV